MKKKEIQNMYQISERYFWHLVEDNKIFRVSYRDYELDKDYFKKFSIEVYRQERFNSEEKKAQRAIANKKRSETLKRKLCSKEKRSQMSEIAKNLWKSDIYRKHNSDAVKAAYQKPEVRERLSKAMRAVFDDPEVRERHKQKVRAAYQKPELRKKISEATRQAFQQRGKEIAQKAYETKKRNHSFNTSREEKQAKKLFEKDSINYIHQYRSDLYPFDCDFYLPDLDVYVELHCHWSHGGAPYNANELWCKNALELWKEKSKTSAYYSIAVQTWTDRDVKKRQCAIDNKLNWKCFYTYEEFLNWYNSEVKHD